MKFFLRLLLIFLAFSCSNSEKDDPLILPPNFAEVPDLEKPETKSTETNQEDVARLKELLLQSEE